MYEKRGFGISVAIALWFFEVPHHPLPERVKGIEAVGLAVATVPLTFLWNTNAPLLKNFPDETLPFIRTFYLFYFCKLNTIQLIWRKCCFSLGVLVWLHALAFLIPHAL